MSLGREDPIAGSDWSKAIAAIAANGDRSAFAALFGHFAPRIKAYMLRAGASPSSAEELAQEALLMVWRKAALFDPASTSPAGWIFTIARNLRIDALRRERRAGIGESCDAEFEIDDSPPPDAQVAAVFSEARVRAALTGLSPEQMRVVELSFFEDRPHAEIANVLGIPLGTVKSRLRLAMGRLRTLLGDLS